jgi:putative tryptophan/tyrosine transport system substrate-binding protein
VRRREFIRLLGGAAVAWPLAARAQQPSGMRRIGALIGLLENDPESQARLGAFRKGLLELGWIEGRNIQIEYRWAGADTSRLQAYAAELVALRPDVIFAASGTPLAALHRETRAVPIVFTNSSDPVDDGFVASWARPGGNITGLPIYEYAIAGKWLELLKRIAPHVTRVAVIYDPSQPSSAGFIRMIKTGASSLAVGFTAAGARNAAQIEHAVTAFASQPNGGLIVFPSTAAAVHRDLIVTLAARHLLPAVYPYRLFVAAGGLASYSPDLLELYRRAASYIDRILKGEKPADLPVQAPTKYEFIINLKTAKALGLEVPLHLQQLADEVIE